MLTNTTSLCCSDETSIQKHWKIRLIPLSQSVAILLPQFEQNLLVSCLLCPQFEQNMLKTKMAGMAGTCSLHPWCISRKLDPVPYDYDVLFSIYEWSLELGEGFRIWSDIFKLEVMFSNSERGFEIRSDVFEFGVKFWNLEWAFRIKSELLESGVSFYNYEWTLRIRSELLELRVNFYN